MSEMEENKTEKEGAFVNMDEELKDNAGQELSPRRNISGREFFLWEEVRVQDFYHEQEEMTFQYEVGVTVQQEMYHWEEIMEVHYLWHEDDDRYREYSQWEEDPAYQELCQQEGEGYQDLSLLQDVQGHPQMCQLEVDKRDLELSQEKGYSIEDLPQWEKNKSDQNQSQQEESMSSQRLSQWGEGDRYKTWNKPLDTENHEDAQTCAQQRPSFSSSIGSKVSGEAVHELPSTSPALGSPMEAEPLAAREEKAPDSPVDSDEVLLSGTESPETETDSPESPGTESPASHTTPGCCQALLDLTGHISSEVVCKAVLEVQATGQQPEEQRDLEQSIAAELEAAAPAERKERLISAPLSPSTSPSTSHSTILLGAQALRDQQEEADRGSGLSEQESKKGTLAGELELFQYDDKEDPELSHQKMNKYQEVSQEEACTKQELSPGEAGSYQELSPGELCTEQELSPGEVGSYQELSPGEAFTEQELSPGEVGSYQELSPGEAFLEQELSPGEVGSYQELSPGEAFLEQELSPGEVGSYQELSPGEAFLEQELSPGEVGSYQELSPGEAFLEQELSPGEVGSYQELSPGEPCTEQELSPGEVGSNHELSQGEDCTEQELYLEESRSYLEFSDWDECMEKELSQEVGSSQKLSNCKECSGQELSPEVSSYQELSDWEESIGQELSEEEASIGQKVFKGNINRPSMQSSWKNDSDKELMQDSCEYMSVHSTSVKLSLQKEDEWDDLSVLELSGEDTDKRLGCFVEDGLPAPVSQEACVEPCPQVPLGALPPHVKAQAPRGPAVPPAFKKQVPEAGPAQYSYPSCSGPWLGARAQAFRWQPAPHKKHHRPALWGLFRQVCCPCLAPHPED
nr:uncharacterized protein LOC115491209 [Taeniopygia guttata]